MVFGVSKTIFAERRELASAGIQLAFFLVDQSFILW